MLSLRSERTSPRCTNAHSKALSSSLWLFSNVQLNGKLAYEKTLNCDSTAGTCGSILRSFPERGVIQLVLSDEGDLPLQFQGFNAP